MTSSVRHVVLASALFTPVLAFASELDAQKVFRDDSYGFEMRIPKDFRQIPVRMDEKWIVAKFLYKRALEPKNGWAERTPEIRVIVFPKVDMKQVIAARKQREKVRVVGKGGKVTVVTLLEHLNNPFRNYHEYLRENYKKGGWFVAEEKAMKIGSLDAVYKKIDVEEKMGDGLKSTLFAYEIDLGDAIYVVQCESLKDHDHKFVRGIRGTAKTFKDRPRTKALRTAISTADPDELRKKKIAEAKARKNMTAEDRKKEKLSTLARAIAKAKELLPKGWKSYKDGPFTVFHSTPIRFAKKVSKQANVMWRWMDANFAYVGTEHSVGAILRICKDSAEGQAYRDQSTRSGSELTRREIVLWDDKDWGFTDYGSGRLNQAILHQYLSDKNARLWYAMPPWLDWGMGLYIDSLKLKGSKMTSKADEWDMEIIRENLRSGKFKASKKLITAKYENFSATQEDRVQCFAMLSFMMGKGRKHRLYGNVIEPYLKGLDRRMQELNKMWDKALDDAVGGKTKKDGDDSPQTQEWFREWKKKREKIYDELLEEVFGKWSDKDWKTFDKAWKKAYK